METGLTHERPRRTLFSALDERGAHYGTTRDMAPASQESIWGKPFEQTSGAPAEGSGAGATGLGRSRSFLDVYRQTESRPWIDDVDAQDASRDPSARLSRRPTVTDEVDEDAPPQPRIRTVLSATGDSGDADDTERGVPVVSATAAALANLAQDDVTPVEKDKKKKKKKKVINEKGEVVVRKKKRDKDGTERERKDPARRKKRVSVRRKGEEDAVEQPAEIDWMDELTPTTYLDSIRDDPNAPRMVPAHDEGDGAYIETSHVALAPSYSGHDAVEDVPLEAPRSPEAVAASREPEREAPLSPPLSQPIVSSPIGPAVPLSPVAPAVPMSPVAPAVPMSPVVTAVPDVHASQTAVPPAMDAVATEAAIVSPGVRAAMDAAPSSAAATADASSPVFLSRAAPIAEKWRKGQLDADAMSVVSVSTYAPTLDERMRVRNDVYGGGETTRMHVFNQNASRLVINVYILYHGLFVMLRRLWRWEQPWLTGGVAAFYTVVWWRGDLLAIFFLCTFLYIATFRWLHLPAEETFEPSDSDEPGLRRTPSNRTIVRRTHRLDLVATQPLTVTSSAMLQQIGDQILIYTHGLADVHERMKNLAMWRNPIVTLRYLGWLLLFVVLSAHITTWMMIKLPGALVFLCVFVVAPMIEYGYWGKVWDYIQEAPAPTQGTRPFVSSSRTVLDQVLSNVPTDEEYLHQTRLQARWETEREKRRRGEFVEMEPNRIVEEVTEPRVRRRKDTRPSKPARRVLQRWQDATDGIEEPVPMASRRMSRHRPVTDLTGVFSEPGDASAAAHDTETSASTLNNSAAATDVDAVRPLRSARRGYILSDRPQRVSQPASSASRLRTVPEPEAAETEAVEPEESRAAHIAEAEAKLRGSAQAREAEAKRRAAAHMAEAEAMLRGAARWSVIDPELAEPEPVEEPMETERTAQPAATETAPVQDAPVQPVSAPGVPAEPANAPPIPAEPAYAPLVPQSASTRQVPEPVGLAPPTAASLVAPPVTEVQQVVLAPEASPIAHKIPSDASRPDASEASAQATEWRAQPRVLPTEPVADAVPAAAPVTAHLPPPVQSQPAAPPAAQFDSGASDTNEPQWEDVESAGSEYAGEEDEDVDQRTVAERALSALGFSLPASEPASAAPEAKGPPSATEAPHVGLLPAWESAPPARLQVAPAPPLFQVPHTEVHAPATRNVPEETRTATQMVEVPAASVAAPEATPGKVTAAVPVATTATNEATTGPWTPQPAAPAVVVQPAAPAPAAHPVAPMAPASASPPSGRPMYIAAQSDSLQEQLERRRRMRQHQRDVLENSVARKSSYASLSLSQDGVAMSPAVSVDAVHARVASDAGRSPSPSPSRSMGGGTRGIRWFDDAGEPNIYLAVYRKRVGHLVVLPTRIVFQLTHSTIKPMRLPPNLSDIEAARLTKEVDGRIFYPLISPRDVREMVRAEAQGQGRTPFEAYSVMSAVIPEPNRVMFDAPLEQIATIKRTRKNTPVLDTCAEGLEIVLQGQPKGLTLPAVVDRDQAFQRILALDPSKWPA
ncbi:hypothetical protein MBRA1_000217 [Malassezia brasiliensis]|uniref:Uncharacterized protein n=1 Tax=Malassezia brasiliensis TaxID=1821822 RepID=A0AAF0DRT8_9BASI|nr:hypothetical protein MBRA1_000217 [Malassezia brasiliensis]